MTAADDSGDGGTGGARLPQTGTSALPVTVLTGFLGSGKTTLLGRLLRQPALARTAVIINEMGEIGLDHELVEASSESLIELETGCLCCAIRGDLAETLADLLARRDAGSVQAFERIVIETSGIADPAPILQLLMTDRGLARRLVLAGVVTTVDAALGLATLEREPQSIRQAAVADRLVITKTDLAGGLAEALDARLRQINPSAPRFHSVRGEIAAEALLDGIAYDPAMRGGDVARWLAEPPEPVPASAEAGAPLHAHDAAITSISLTHERPIRAIVLTLLLETLAEHCGRDLLRLKGIIHLAESPERPAVVHGVQHVFSPVEMLDGWPSADRRSRLVLIGRRLHRGFVAALLDALEAEVADAAAAGADGPRS